MASSRCFRENLGVQIRAIVFDSNVFGAQALPNVKTIELWAQACVEHDAELWIPDVVAYELAQHAMEAHEDAMKAYSAHLRRLEAWGQAVVDGPEPISVDSLVNAMISAGAVIVHLEGAEARAAVLDQVLLKGVGRRKQGVKTGAADSAWVRSVVAHNLGDTDGLVVVTGDSQALEQTCSQLDVDVPRHAKHLGELRHLLNESLNADEDETNRFKAWIDDEFVTAVAGQGRRTAAEDLVEAAGIGAGLWWDLPPIDDDGFEPWEMQERVVGPIRSVTIVADVEHDRWADSLTGVLELEATVEEQYARQDAFGDYLEYQVRTYPGRIRGWITLYQDGEELVWDHVIENFELVSPGEAEIWWNPAI